MLDFRGNGLPLSKQSFARSADALGVDAAKLWAVVEIEARSCGFLNDRRPVILFERHKFHEQTSGRFDDRAPDVSHRKPGGYGKGGQFQYSRLEKALALDQEAALSSTSWGLGQVMGFNFQIAGFQSVETMVLEMCRTEESQIVGMVNFIIENGLHKYLQVGDWVSFARGYNGSRYYINQYDVRLNSAHQKYRIGPLPDLKIREAQVLLSYLGYDPGPVDGWLGKQTLIAMNSWRENHGKDDDDVITDDDVDQLWEHVE